MKYLYEVIVIDLLRKINYWWASGDVEQSFFFNVERYENSAVCASFTQRRITAVVGPRRVGKSTLLLQAIHRLIAAGVEPKRILYFSGDEPGLANMTIHQLIDSYLAEVLFEDHSSISEKVYIFIDEIHFVADWQRYLKSYYDRRYNLKFFVSGSSAQHLFHQSKESLLGRIESINIAPLGFKQFARFSLAKQNLSNPAEQWSYPAPDYFDMAAAYEIIVNRWQDNRMLVEPVAGKLQSEYFFAGGYIEFFETASRQQWLSWLRDDVIEKNLFRDVTAFYNIKNADVLEKLLYCIADNQGQGFSTPSLGQTVGLDKVTTALYLNYLADCYLVNILENYSPNLAKISRKNKKLYVADHGVRNSLLRQTELDSTEIGKIVETAMVNNVRTYAKENLARAYYWREGDYEADIVLDMNTKLLPIEVKYRESITDKDLAGLRKFMGIYNCPCGLVVTKNLLKRSDDLYFVPFWML